MKRLTYENGHIIIREMDGTLFWSSHWLDIRDAYNDEYSEGGYKTILIEGTLTEKNIYLKDKKFEL